MWTLSSTENSEGNGGVGYSAWCLREIGDYIAHSLGLINDCVLFLWSVYFYIELLDEIIPLTNHSLVCVTTINSIIEQHC